jgi:hypothetical protein
MRIELNCLDLYNKYIDMESYSNQKFVEVYSYDYEEWLVMNTCMLRVSPSYEEDDDEFFTPAHENNLYNDILATNYKEWDDWNNAPFENVYRVNTNSYGIVSSDILDLCLSATNLRRYQDMSRYISTYENYSRKFTLIQFGSGNCNYAFVPKEFIMVNASQYDENDDDNINNDSDDSIKDDSVIEGAVLEEEE